MICFTCPIHFVSFTLLPVPSGVNTIIEHAAADTCFKGGEGLGLGRVVTASQTPMTSLSFAEEVR